MLQNLQRAIVVCFTSKLRVLHIMSLCLLCLHHSPPTTGYLRHPALLPRIWVRICPFNPRFRYKQVYSDRASDAKRIIILLAMANTTAQIMNLHRLDSIPLGSASQSELIQHETQKRVWCFLCIQDHYLVTFKRSYSIVMAHSKTPAPNNCSEEDLGTSLPNDWFTQSTYQLLQLDMTNIARTLFDTIANLERIGSGPAEIFEKILEADTSMTRLAQDMRYWLKAPPRASGATPDRYTDSTETVVENVRRTMRISFCHMRLAMHRSFFCRSLADKRFHYSYSTCLDSARAILHETRQSRSKKFETDCWTIPAHIISACIIVMLKTVFAQCMVVDELSSQGAQDQALMEECLDGLRPLRERNKIVERGMTLIQRLMDSKYDAERRYTALDAEEMVRLVHEVEEKISIENGMVDISYLGLSDGTFMMFE